MTVRIASSGTTRLGFFSIPLAAFSIVLSVGLLVHLLGLSNRGFDFTDEGYYLNWISSPWAFVPETSQFGFIYHPIYRLLNGDVAGLRRFSIIINFTVALLVAFCAIRPGSQSSFDWTSTLVRAAVSFAAATLTFLLYRLWLPTPSYNSLALLSVLSFAGGVLLTRSSHGSQRFAGWHIMSFAVFLAFAAKPTTALMLTALAAVYGLISGRFRIVDLLSASAFFVVLFVAFAWASYGSPKELIVSLFEAAAAAVLLSDVYTAGGVMRLDTISLPPYEIWVFCAAVLLLALSGIAFPKRFDFAMVAVSVASFLALASAQLLSGTSFYPRQSSQLGLLLLAVPSGALVLLAVRTVRRDRLSVLANIDWPTVAVFACLPIAFILGSGGNYWSGAIGAGLFWVLAGLMVLNGTQPSIERLLPSSAFAQALTTFIVAFAVNAPYRQPEPLASQNTEFVYGAAHSLFLGADAQRYLTDLRATAVQHGFRPDDYVVDLTGHSPGAIFAIGAQSVGRAWIIGGYPGSQKLVVRTLRAAPCEQVARAWVLLEQGGPREISVVVLQELGLDAKRDYEWIPPVRAATIDGNGRPLQVLLRPRADNIKICE